MNVRFMPEDGRAAELYRMAHWAAIAAVLYAIGYFWSPATEADAGLQSAVYHYANLTARAFVGYWIGRGVFGRIDQLYIPKTAPDAIVLASKIIARAIVIGYVISTSK